METIKPITLPEKWADKVRKLDVAEMIDITEKGRATALNQAKLAFPLATFKTQQDHNKRVYLIRTA